MKNFFVAVVLVLLVGGGLAFWFIQKLAGQPSQNQNQNQSQTINKNPMNITSSAFEANQPIPSKYTCDGDGINPSLQFMDVPSSAVSLALIVDDPDAPMGTWVHWTVWNISPSTTEVAENSVPQGAILGKTSSGQNIYGGPCPPSGTHHYHFKLYALDTKLTIPSYSTSEELNAAMQGHILQQAELIGLYSRSNQQN